MNSRFVALLALACAGSRTAKEPAVTERAAPPAAPASSAPVAAPVALDGLGSHRRPVTGASAEAQRWFDQGLNLVFAFNHDEAIRAFAHAAALAPDCAMASWGLAYANGPHINNPQVDEEHAAAAWAALKRAQAASAGASASEKALIDALARRYANPQPTDRAPLDAAYAEAMRDVHRRFSGDADVAALTAEALMDVHPWDY